MKQHEDYASTYPLPLDTAGILLSSTEDAQRRLEYLGQYGIGTADWKPLPRSKKFDLLETAIGGTPLSKVHLQGGTCVHTKEEFSNPSGSHYDRVYLETIRHLESIGFLQPGDSLRDISSGSSGISLALIGTLLDYDVQITVPDELPQSRLRPIRHFGGKVIHAGTGYVPRASQKQLAEIKTYRGDDAWEETRPADHSCRSLLFSNGDERICYLNHSENDLSPKAFGPIATEVVAALPSTSHLLLAEGNWTTISGIATAAKLLLPDIKIISYSGETHGDTTTNFGTTVPGVPLRFKDESLADCSVIVTDIERDQMRPSAKHLGNSALMGLFAAQNVLAKYSEAKIVTIGYDLANRY